MIESLAVALLASFATPLCPEAEAYERLLSAEEVVSLSSEGSRTFDVGEGLFLTVLSPEFDAPDGAMASSALPCSVRDKGIVVGTSTIDDGDTSFAIGKTSLFGSTEESRGVYEITLPDIDYRSLISATFVIRGFSSGNLNSLNFYQTPASYYSITGLSNPTTTFVGSAAIAPNKSFTLDITSAVSSKLEGEQSLALTLIAQGTSQNALREFYSSESNYSQIASILYNAPTVMGTGAATAYQSSNNAGVNCFWHAIGNLEASSPLHPSYLYQTGNLSLWEIEHFVIPSIESTAIGGNAHVRLIASRTAPIYSYEWRVAFRCGKMNNTFANFHFMKQTSTGRWAEKNGESPSAMLPLNTTPDTASVWSELYDSPTYYFAFSY